jgi:hypothetical protein
MDYADIEIGQQYLYRGQVVEAVGTRLCARPQAKGGDVTFVRILMDHRSTSREVKPHELSRIPVERIPMDDVRATCWNSAYYSLARARDDCAMLAQDLHPSFQQLANECRRLQQEMLAFRDTYTFRDL